MNIDGAFIQFTKDKLEASSIQIKEVVQNLWSGYGKIFRLKTDTSTYPTVIAKYIHPSGVVQSHPRGWNTNRSNQRKIRSYQVEKNWFEHYASHCTEAARVPKCLGILENEKKDVWILMEDLDAVGFSARKENLSFAEMKPVIGWLASFHSCFIAYEPHEIWPIGTYWHLDTRPDELESLNDLRLKQFASWIDDQLNKCPYQTFVHGDAKVANFCFNNSENTVAAVDFQYVGGGCGMKDLAYFVGSCLDENSCELLEEEILDLYFSELEKALLSSESKFYRSEIEEHWRPLYKVAWADFHRFLKGWSPGHWKINSYSERVVREVLEYATE